MQVSSHQTYARALMGEYEEAPLGGRLLDDSDLADVANRVAEMALGKDDEAESQPELLPQTATEKEGSRSHTRGVWRVRPLSGNRVISASYDGTAKVWNLGNDAKPQVLKIYAKDKKNQREVLSLTELGDGTIVTGTANGIMSFWNGANCASKGFINESARSTQGFYSMVVLDNDVLATGACQRPKEVKGNWNHDIKLWDLKNRAKLQDKTPLCILKGHKGGVSGLVVLADALFASSSADKTLKIWDALAQEVVATLEGHDDYVYSLALCSENLLVSGSRDKTVRLWDARSYKECGTLQMPKSLEAHASTVHDVASYQEFGILTASRDAYVKLWDRRQPGRPIKILDTEDSYAYSVTCVADGLIAAGTLAESSRGKSGNVRLWELK